MRLYAKFLLRNKKSLFVVIAEIADKIRKTPKSEQQQQQQSFLVRCGCCRCRRHRQEDTGLEINHPLLLLQLHQRYRRGLQK